MGRRRKIRTHLKGGAASNPGTAEGVPQSFVIKHGQVGTSLRTLLNNNGFSAVKIIGYEHNWNDAAGYPVSLVSISFI